MFEDMVFYFSSFFYMEGGRFFLYMDGVMDFMVLCYLFDLLKDYFDLFIVDLKEKIFILLYYYKEVYYKSDDECFILVDLK